eukprot:4189870-Prymnesium_polylepis.1
MPCGGLGGPHAAASRSRPRGCPTPCTRLPAQSTHRGPRASHQSVGVAAAARRHAVLVVHEHKADGDAAEREEEEADQAQVGGRRDRVHLGHALGRGDLDVDAGAVREQQRLRLDGDVGREHDDRAEDDGDARDEVEEERHERLEAAQL